MMMKNISFIAIISLLLLSCSEELDQTPISELGSNNFYKDTEDFEDAVTGIYSTLDIYPNEQFYLSEMRSDNLYGVTETGVRPYEKINNFDLTIATNEDVSREWNNDYTGIMRANTVLDEINEEAVPDADTRNRMIAEAKFLRAFFYFDLVRLYGGVPLLDHVYTPAETLNISRSPVSEVYDFIIADLNDAIENLPESYSNNFLGKATSWAAKALLGEIYLTRSGPTYGINGPGLESGEYDKALSLFNDIIDNGPFGFVDDYPSIFAYDNEHNAEIIFNIEYITGGTGAGASYPSITVPNGYLEANNVGFPNGEDRKEVSVDLLEAYPEEDIREDFNILMGYTDDNENFNPSPFFVKYINLNEAGQDRFDWSLNYPVIRYTDILMMKAEAILMGNIGNSGDVDDIINMVRQRAGLGEVSGVDLDMYLSERRREFAAESKRWYSLVRTGKVLEVMNAWIPEEDVQNRMNLMDANQIIYPIPSDQITVKEGLYEQNPGYN